MRPYVRGVDFSNISVSEEDDPPNVMGIIAKDPNNHLVQWYASKQYFEKNFEPA
jgi:hypothetical protein